MKYCLLLLFTCLLNFILFPHAGLAQARRLEMAPANQHQAPDKLLQFIENKNQWDPSVSFMAPIPGGKLYLQPQALLFSFIDTEAIGHQHTKGSASKPAATSVKAHAYSVNFLGASPGKGQIQGRRAATTLRNYFLGNDPARWASGVRAFEEAYYQNLYPGIGMRLYENRQQLKYEFLVAPNTDPNAIRMQYKGATQIQLVHGALHIKTSINEVTEQKPFAYQMIGGRQVEVACNFKLQEDIVTFDLPQGYDPSQPLIIDPVLSFSTYSGSTADNWGFTATYDQEGNMYSGGIVVDQGFPVTVGAYDLSFNGTRGGFEFWDVGILKYKTTASGPASLLYATYIGGNLTEAPSSLVINSNNELLILGTTSSANFPTTTGAQDQSFNGGQQNTNPIGGVTYGQGSDLFISRLSPTGDRLQASTFLGGSQNEGLLNQVLDQNYGDKFRADVLTDADNNVYIVSSTQSADFPIVGGFQRSFGQGGSDALVAKLSPGLRLMWSSYLGGSGQDAAYSIQLDSRKNIFICGGTTSSNLPSTSGAYQTTIQGRTDGFVASISNDGQVLQKLSYLGTSAPDQAYFVQLDEADNIYLLGQTLGNYPVSPDVYSNANGRQFIHKLSNDLSTSLFSTVFGALNATSTGRANISPTAFLVDNCSRIYVCGWGGGVNSSDIYFNGTVNNMPITPDAFQKTTDGQDFYLMLLGPDASRLEYATYFGGSQPSGMSGEHVDGGTSRFDKRGYVYQAVCAACGQAGSSSGFPTTPGAWSQNNNGITGTDIRCNNAAFKFDMGILKAEAGEDQVICANQGPFQLTGFNPAGGTWSGPGVSATGLFTPDASLAGTVTLTYTITSGSCVSTSTKTITVNAADPVSFTGLSPRICLPAAPLPLTPSIPGGTFSGPGIIGASFDAQVAGNGTHTITYTYTNASGCTTTSSQTVQVGTSPVVSAGPDERICSGSYPLLLTGFSPAGGTWSGTGVDASGLFTPSEAIVGTHVLTYTVSNGFCTVTKTKTVVVDPTIKFTQGPPISLCPDGAAYAITDITPPGGSWTGTGVSTEGIFTPSPSLIGSHQLTYFVQVGACSGISTQQVTISAPPVIRAEAVPTECGSPTNIQGFAPFTARFTNNSTGATGYLWEFGDGGTSTEINPSHQYTRNGNYEIYLTAFYGNGCQVKQKIAVAQVDKDELVPNVFTPNGDGLNDTFVPRITCLPVDLKIYNRWGKLVYEQKNYQNNWGGEQVVNGIYYYQLTSSKGQTWKGWVEIVR